MITKMNYLLLSTMMLAAIDNSYGRCCDCCKKLCGNKDSNEKNETGNIINNTGVTNPIINNLEEELNYKNNNEETNEDDPGPYYYEIISDPSDVAKDCFCSHWYKVNKSSVIRLKRIGEKNDSAWEVTGNDNMWTIACNNNSGLNKKEFNPEKRTWIIFNITTWNSRTKKPVNNYIFYVNDISLWKGEFEFEGYILKELSAFEGVECYTWTLLHANTANVKNFANLFNGFSSVVEKDENTNLSGLKGLEKLNVTNADNISKMFFRTIYKQNTLNQLSKWQFGNNVIFITELFNSSRSKELNFHALDGWAPNCNNENSKFMLTVYTTEDTKKKVFFSSSNPDVGKLPKWYAKIG